MAILKLFGITGSFAAILLLMLTLAVYKLVRNKDEDREKKKKV